MQRKLILGAALAVALAGGLVAAAAARGVGAPPEAGPAVVRHIVVTSADVAGYHAADQATWDDYGAAHWAGSEPASSGALVRLKPGLWRGTYADSGSDRVTVRCGGTVPAAGFYIGGHDVALPPGTTFTLKVGRLAALDPDCSGGAAMVSANGASWALVLEQIATGGDVR